MFVVHYPKPYITGVRKLILDDLDRQAETDSDDSKQKRFYFQGYLEWLAAVRHFHHLALCRRCLPRLPLYIRIQHIVKSVDATRDPLSLTLKLAHLRIQKLNLFRRSSEFCTSLMLSSQLRPERLFFRQIRKHRWERLRTILRSNLPPSRRIMTSRGRAEEMLRASTEPQHHLRSSRSVCPGPSGRQLDTRGPTSA